MTQPDDDFYVGYLDAAPGGPGRRGRAVAAAAIVLLPLAALGLAAAHAARPAAAFEFGVSREFEGVLRAHPFPALLVDRRGDDDGRAGYTTYLLVGRGKHGAGPLVAGLHGSRVRLSGSLVARDGAAMIETGPGPIVRLEPAGPVEGGEDLGDFTLAGEIVDGKCYLGVMNPGEGKTHRDCAVRCISGGAPPMLVARDALGNVARLLLVGRDGRAINAELLDLVAEPVTVTGRVERLGDALVLRAEPSEIRRAS